jgi:hypothetical protein
MNGGGEPRTNGKYHGVHHQGETIGKLDGRLMLISHLLCKMWNDLSTIARYWFFDSSQIKDEL